MGPAEIATGEVDVAPPIALDRGFPDFARLAASAAQAAGMAGEARTGLRTGLMLAMRFLQARFLSVWGLVLAAALCPPEAFTEFAVFSTIANFVSLAALLRFEAVFFQNADPLRLGQAVRLALAAGSLFVGIVAAGLLVALTQGWVRPEIAALFIVSLTSRAVMRLMMSEATAEGDFATMGNNNIVQAAAQPAMMLLLIWLFGPVSLALLAADAAGHAVSAFYLLWRRWSSLMLLTRRHHWSLGELRQSAARWARAPRILLPSALLSFGFMTAPLLALPLATNPLLAAHVALAMRLLEMSSQFFGTISGPLVMNTLRRTPQHDRQRATRFITIGLAAGAACLFGLIALLSLGADVFLDGTRWSGVGQVITVLALFYGGSALVVPLHEIATLSQKPQRQLATNAVALALAILLVLWFGTLSLTLLGLIGLVSLARMLAHVRFAWTRLGPDRFAQPASSPG